LNFLIQKYKKLARILQVLSWHIDDKMSVELKFEYHKVCVTAMVKKCTCSALVDTKWLLLCFVFLIHGLSIPILCRNGIKLCENDENFIVENILNYHPEKEKKMAGHDNFIMVSNLHFYLLMHQKNQTGNA
jgi:hypothetical protein